MPHCLPKINSRSIDPSIAERPANSIEPGSVRQSSLQVPLYAMKMKIFVTQWRLEKWRTLGSGFTAIRQCPHAWEIYRKCLRHLDNYNITSVVWCGLWWNQLKLKEERILKKFLFFHAEISFDFTLRTKPINQLICTILHYLFFAKAMLFLRFLISTNFCYWQTKTV